jgi:hypothetical protein
VSRNKKSKFHTGEVVRVEDLRHPECLGAIPLPSRFGDLCVLAHPVTTIKEGGRVRYSIPTLPHRPGLYGYALPLGLGYLGLAAEQPLSVRVPESIQENLPGHPQFVVTVSSLMGAGTPQQWTHGEALALDVARPLFCLTNDQPGAKQVLPHGPQRDQAERAATALVEAMEFFARPLPCPRDAAHFQRAVFENLGVALHVDTLFALMATLTSHVPVDAGTAPPFVRRNLTGRQDGTKAAGPVGEGLGDGWYAPLGYRSQSKFGKRLPARRGANRDAHLAVVSTPVPDDISATGTAA